MNILLILVAFLENVIFKYVPKTWSSEEVPFSKELVLVRNSFTADYFWVVVLIE